MNCISVHPKRLQVKPNIYLMLVLITALPAFYSLHAQIPAVQGTVQAKNFHSHKELSADAGISPGWYSEAVKNLQQLEEQINPVRPYGCFTATNMRNQTGYYLSPAGYTVANRQQNAWQVAFQLSGIGRSTSQYTPGRSYTITHSRNRLQYEFKGKEQNSNINLYWKTSHEETLNRFEVERSRDGSHFESIGIVFPWESASHIDYAFPDKNADAGTLYYRLKMIDNNTDYKYSNILTFSVTEPTTARVVVAPNPIVDRIGVQFTGLPANSYRIALHNVAGQKFAEQTILITRFRQTEYLMRPVSMTPGIYFLTVLGKNNAKIASNRVVVF